MALIFGCWFEDNDPGMRMIEEADDLRDARIWAQSQGATVVFSDDDGESWTALQASAR